MMKKLLVMITLVLLLFVTGRNANAQGNLTARSEGIVKAFYVLPIIDNVEFMNHGILFTDSTGYLAVLGFHGLGFKVSDSDKVYALVGEKVDNNGVQGIIALWGIQTLGKVNCFEEVNLRVRILGEIPSQVCGWAHATYTVRDGFEIGMATEHVTRLEGKYDVASVGLLVKTGTMTFFPGIDFRPSKGNPQLFLRVMYTVQ